MKTLGIILIVLGVLAFVYTGFNYTKKEKVLDVGKVEINKDKEKSVNWSPIVGVVLVVAGGAMVFLDKKGSRV